MLLRIINKYVVYIIICFTLFHAFFSCSFRYIPSFFNIRKVVNCIKTEMYLCRCWGISCGSRPGRAACSPRTSWHTAGHSPIGYKIIYMAIMAACSLRISWHTAGYSPIGYKIWNMVIRAVCPHRGFGYLLSQPVEELKQEAFFVKNKHFTSNICTAVGI